jgi:hypothetical protein
MSQVIENTEFLPSSADDNPIRVLHIITRMIVGGAQENTLLSVEGLDAMKEYDVDWSCNKSV